MSLRTSSLSSIDNATSKINAHNSDLAHSFNLS
jgi:hypothetical protein